VDGDLENGRFYLARRSGLREIELVDGGHDGPEAVVKAARIFKRVYQDEGPWVMVQVGEVPVLGGGSGVAAGVEHEELYERMRRT